MNAANDKADDLAVEKGRKSPRRGSKLSERRRRRRRRSGPPSVRAKTRRGKRRGARPTTGEAGV